jgi:hypothetical protein
MDLFRWLQVWDAVTEKRCNSEVGGWLEWSGVGVAVVSPQFGEMPRLRGRLLQSPKVASFARKASIEIKMSYDSITT